MSAPSLGSVRSWKWIVGIVYIVLAVVLYLLGRISLLDAALLFGLGVILV